jgi:hypothetical protein
MLPIYYTKRTLGQISAGGLKSGRARNRQAMAKMKRKTPANISTSDCDA